MKWGVIGTRGYAQRAAVPAIKGSSGGELIAVLGRDRDRTSEFGREHGPQDLDGSDEVKRRYLGVGI